MMSYQNLLHFLFEKQMQKFALVYPQCIQNFYWGQH